MSVLWGTCLMHGRHTPGSIYAKECPLNPEKKQKKSDARKRGWMTRRARKGQGDQPRVS
jgi:hypothetical protein